MKEYLKVTERQIKTFYSEKKKSDISDETVDLMLELVEFINGEIDDIEITYEDKAKAGFKRRMAIKFLNHFNELDMVDVYVRGNTLFVHEHDDERLKYKKKPRTTQKFREDIKRFNNGEINSLEIACGTPYRRKYLLKIAKEELDQRAIVYSQKNVIYIER